MNKERLIKMTLKELAKRYPIGLYEFLFKYKEDLYKVLQELEEKIDNAYLTGTVDELKKALREYWTFHMRAIHIFESNYKQETNLLEARREMSEERIRA